LAEVWLRFKLDKLGKPTATEVLWCSVADSTYETAALEAMVSKVFDRERKVWGKTGKWLRHTVYFRTQPSSTTDFDNPASADSLVVPEMLDPRQPVYPLSAKKANKQGSITVHALVDGSGTVIEAYCDSTCKINSLNNAALMAAFQNKFKPGSIDGKFSAGWVKFRFDFKLSDG
jgi:TonB family protein